MLHASHEQASSVIKATELRLSEVSPIQKRDKLLGSPESALDIVITHTGLPKLLFKPD
jgi:hypothetical protein